MNLEFSKARPRRLGLRSKQVPVAIFDDSQVAEAPEETRAVPANSSSTSTKAPLLSRPAKRWVQPQQAAPVNTIAGIHASQVMSNNPRTTIRRTEADQHKHSSPVFRKGRTSTAATHTTSPSGRSTVITSTTNSRNELSNASNALVRPARRAPLQASQLRDYQNVPATDVAGAKTGKENVPPQSIEHNGKLKAACVSDIILRTTSTPQLATVRQTQLLPSRLAVRSKNAYTLAPRTPIQASTEAAVNAVPKQAVQPHTMVSQLPRLAARKVSAVESNEPRSDHDATAGRKIDSFVTSKVGHCNDTDTTDLFYPQIQLVKVSNGSAIEENSKHVGSAVEVSDHTTTSIMPVQTSGRRTMPQIMAFTMFALETMALNKNRFPTAMEVSKYLLPLGAPKGATYQPGAESSHSWFAGLLSKSKQSRGRRELLLHTLTAAQYSA